MNTNDIEMTEINSCEDNPSVVTNTNFGDDPFGELQTSGTWLLLVGGILDLGLRFDFVLSGSSGACSRMFKLGG
ncbi:unnamed protein product [Rodentolepis nana]|uniref:Uncharacterized protein n=1 Tax=Rodentolepis nana TaxID=102285 RepID=A0A0R3TIE3_RODNA|nr:unnamed protein product [Rodentolepis nana]